MTLNACHFFDTSVMTSRHADELRHWRMTSFHVIPVDNDVIFEHSPNIPSSNVTTYFYIRLTRCAHWLTPTAIVTINLIGQSPPSATCHLIGRYEADFKPSSVQNRWTFITSSNFTWFNYRQTSVLQLSIGHPPFLNIEASYSLPSHPLKDKHLYSRRYRPCISYIL